MGTSGTMEPHQTSVTEMCVEDFLQSMVEEHVRHLADKYYYDFFFVCFFRKKLDTFITK